MAEPHVISALKKKHSELSGDLVRIYKEERKLRAELKIIDESLKIFGCVGTEHKQKIIRPYKKLFARNELPRLLRIIDRERPDLKSYREIAREIMARKEWDTNDGVLHNRIALKVRDAMGKYEIGG